jgi:hypothetical protein
MKIAWIAFLCICLCFSGMSQKIRFASSIGTSNFNWYENQTTVDLGAQLTFKLPQKRYEIYAKVKALGNVQDSQVNHATYQFVTPAVSSNIHARAGSEAIYSQYRGGQAQLGVLWHFASGLQPIVELYSKSIARRISREDGQYLEEEKYALHGLSLGLQYEAKIKDSKLILHAKVFEPLYHGIKFYGEYAGIPKASMTSKSSLNYQTGLELRIKKYGLGFQYEVLNMGAVDNPNTKSIPALEASILSTLLSFHF